MCELFPEIIEKKNEDSLTALHIVVIQNNVDALNILLEFKTNVEAVDSKGHTALHFAVGKLGLLASPTIQLISHSEVDEWTGDEY
jgi:ankyrin repeat protein